MLRKQRNFLASKTWKEFRERIIKERKIDYITHKRLGPYCRVHHCDMSSKNYNNLSDENNFVVVNNETHEMIHWFWRYYSKDEGIIDRLKEVLEKMKNTNNDEVDYQFEENRIMYS